MLGGVALIGLLVYAWLDPEQYVLFPKCPFRMLTGWMCPGCGSQRAIHAFLHGEFREAFLYNPLLMLSVPYLAAGTYLDFFNGRKRYPGLRKALLGPKACIIALIVIILYWIGRNLF